ncbi:MAG: hypothetical protein M1828_000567 [Chrysothrix sp. TS-e1954]|nr:MAG: hypothetical protein M1828_000567 [Chrysothrix sp. TS-e1954]
MLRVLLTALLLGIVNGAIGDHKVPPIVHFTLERRAGPFMWNKTANLKYLVEQLETAESRFNVTQREVRGNKVVRAPKTKAVGGDERSKLIGDIGREGNWYTTMRVGSVKQPIHVDVDMLTADMAFTATSSEVGTKFDEFFSTTYQASEERPFESCTLPRDNVNFNVHHSKKNHYHQSAPLTFPHCKPSKQSLASIDASGGIVGLAPAESLRQMKHEGVSSLVEQLIANDIIQDDIFSITLINGIQGLLSIGGTVADSVAAIDERIESFLGRSSPTAGGEEVLDVDEDAMSHVHNTAQELGNLGNIPGGVPGNFLGRGRARGGFPLPNKDPSKPQEPGGLIKRGLNAVAEPIARKIRRPRPMDHASTPTWRDEWRWSPVEGAEGWWQTLMRGIWVDLVKILKNQPCIIDINTPFILAPPHAAKQFYGSISGSYRLPAPYTNFYAFPCNNPPFMHVEFSGFRFPLMRGMKNTFSSQGFNSKFSLGKVSDDSGYCVGAVVETRMGVGDQAPLKKGRTRKDDALRGAASLESGMLAGNGMRDVWVLGEPIFKGLGIVFDPKQKAIGFRAF